MMKTLEANKNKPKIVNKTLIINMAISIFKKMIEIRLCKKKKKCTYHSYNF